MEETKKLTIPDGYEFDRVENGEVILKKKEVVLPKTFGECNKGMCMSYYPLINWYVPNEHEDEIRALCKLLICRDAWWRQLGWKPDWKDADTIKSVIRYCAGDVVLDESYQLNAILAFPTPKVRDQFLEAFKDLIEEAKELL